MYDEPLRVFSLARPAPFSGAGLFSHLHVSSHSLNQSLSIDPPIAPHLFLFGPLPNGWGSGSYDQPVTASAFMAVHGYVFTQLPISDLYFRSHGACARISIPFERIYRQLQRHRHSHRSFPLFAL